MYCILIILLICCINLYVNSKIAGGRLALPGEFPFAVAIQSDHLLCAGSLISLERVVTAGHCLLHTINGTLVKINLDITVVIGGSVNKDSINDGSYQKRRIKNYQVHGEYRYRKSNTKLAVHDIGVIEVHKSFERSSTLKPMRIISKNPYVFKRSWSKIESDIKECFAIGWGLTEHNKFASILKTIILIPIKHETCVQKWPSEHYKDDMSEFGEVCLLPKENYENACGGDSGSPLTCDGYQYGHLSYGLECGDATTPNFYLLYWNYIEYFHLYENAYSSKAVKNTIEMVLFLILISWNKMYL